MAEKRDIVVVTKFDYTHPDGTVTTYKPGLHRNVDVSVAEHWFVKAHLQEEEAEDEGGTEAPAQAPAQVQGTKRK